MPFDRIDKRCTKVRPAIAVLVSGLPSAADLTFSVEEGMSALLFSANCQEPTKFPERFAFGKFADNRNWQLPHETVYNSFAWVAVHWKCQFTVKPKRALSCRMDLPAVLS